MPNHKKFFILLSIMVAMAGFLFYRQIMRANQITVFRAENPLVSANAVFIPDSESDQTIGNPGAALTIVEFMDIGCARCMALHATIKDFVIKHPQDIRMIWKDDVKSGLLFNYALTHQAAFCASLSGEEASAKSGQQNKFWEFIDIAIANKNNLQEPGLKKIAQDLNLDLEKWWQCANSPETKQIMANAARIADQLGIRSLPTIFANNKLINIDKDINIEEMLENFIKK